MRSELSVSIMLFLALLCQCSKRVHIYVDNGRDQTEVDAMIYAAERQKLEREILALLGLTKRPNKIRDPLKKPAPRYLLDIYNELVVEKINRRTKRSAQITKEEKAKVEESDSIMTFEITNISAVKNRPGKILWFNAKAALEADDALGAELKLYKKRERLSSEYVIQAFELVRYEGKQKLRYLSSAKLSGTLEGWVSLNVTSSFNNWIRNPPSKNKIYVTAYLNDNIKQETSLKELGVSYGVNDENKPFVVAYLKAANQVNLNNLSTIKSRARKSFHDVIDSYESGSRAWRRCRLHMLYVSFRDLRWQDWIIAPAGYAAHYCSGECTFPLNKDMNATNHAIVQSLVRIIQPHRFPRPCCAPTTLIPISLLYLLDDYSATLKNYKNMAVSSCGCQ